MQHASFFQFSAKSNYELGLQLGEHFGEQLRNSLYKAALSQDWIQKVEQSRPYLELTEKYFPQYIEEQKGYAKSAGVDFLEFWTRSLEDELDQEKCTTIITNNGKLISHNEDWSVGSKDLLYLVKKTVGEVTVFEFLYYATLGGNSISINSHGVVQTINTLVHTDHQIGIPRNVTCRFFSETNDIEKDFEKFTKLPCSSGYNHNFVTKNACIYNMESSATKAQLKKVPSPFVHTNHYLGKLQSFENNKGGSATNERYDFACQNVQAYMTIEQLERLSSDTSQGENDSLMNTRTIGKMIVDLEHMHTKVWLLREQEKGWIEYPLDFIH